MPDGKAEVDFIAAEGRGHLAFDAIEAGGILGVGIGLGSSFSMASLPLAAWRYSARRSSTCWAYDFRVGGISVELCVQ